MSQYRTLLVASALCVACVRCVACVDPVRQREIDALGDESPSIAAGPLHRAGQPCLVCHSRGGVASILSAAGTVYRDAEHTSPLAGALVTLADSAGHSIAVHTNCVGNFLVDEHAFKPTFPVFAHVGYREHSIDMKSPMHRNADCGSCHGDPQSTSTAGHVYLEFSAARAADLSVAHCSQESRP